MVEKLSPAPATQLSDDTPSRPAARYEPPAFQVIPLDCEVTAYAPAGDEPLF